MFMTLDCPANAMQPAVSQGTLQLLPPTVNAFGLDLEVTIAVRRPQLCACINF